MFSSVFCFLLKIHCPPVFSVFSLFLLLSSQTSLLEALSTLKFCFLPLLSPSLRGVLFSAFCILLPPLGWASFWILVSVFCILQHSGGPRGAACASVFCFLLSGLSLVSKRQQNPETFSGQASPPPPNVSCFLVFALQTLSHEIISENLAECFRRLCCGCRGAFHSVFPSAFCFLLSAFCFLLSAFCFLVIKKNRIQKRIQKSKRKQRPKHVRASPAGASASAR